MRGKAPQDEVDVGIVLVDARVERFGQNLVAPSLDPPVPGRSAGLQLSEVLHLWGRVPTQQCSVGEGPEMNKQVLRWLVAPQLYDKLFLRKLSLFCPRHHS